MKNGYGIFADVCQKMLTQENLTEAEKKDLERQLRVNEFLAACDDEDIPVLFDSGAFNEIVVRYAKTAMRQAGISEEERDSAITEIRRLFSDYSSKDI